MGCDGGTIPKRDELVKTKKKPEQKDKDAENHCKWRLCSVTQEELRSPVVACELGRLYNKEAVLEMLIDKTKLAEKARHIRNLKDVKVLNLTPNPAFKKDANLGDVYVDHHISQFICPVIGLEMNGKFKFCFIWSCGCVMSERSVKEIKTTVCHKCQKSFEEDDVIPLNPSEDELDAVTTRMEARRAKNKKPKAAKRNGEVEEAGMQNGKKPKTEGSNGPSTSKTATKVVKSPKLEDPELQKLKSGYSVSQDPNASEVFKSIFTSHPKAQRQQKAHWVTYNPFYN
nr:EOG090X0ACT [Eulimnadia texana]